MEIDNESIQQHQIERLFRKVKRMIEGDRIGDHDEFWITDDTALITALQFYIDHSGKIDRIEALYRKVTDEVSRELALRIMREQDPGDVARTG